MAGVNPQGSESYWFNGLPGEGLAKSTPIDEGTENYWFNGLPGEWLYPTGAPSPSANNAIFFGCNF